MVATYETKEAAAAFDAKVDAINAQVQAVMTAVASYGQANLPKVSDEFDVATPIHADDNQTAEVPGDPWQKAAEEARNRTGQSANAYSPFTPPQPAHRIAPPAASMNQCRIQYMGD